MDLSAFVLPLIFLGVIALMVWGVRRSLKETAVSAQRNEALFQSLFPDLQPHFHPERLHEFVKRWQGRKTMPLPSTWMNPPGFTFVVV